MYKPFVETSRTCNLGINFGEMFEEMRHNEDAEGSEPLILKAGFARPCEVLSLSKHSHADQALVKAEQETSCAAAN